MPPASPDLAARRHLRDALAAHNLANLTGIHERATVTVESCTGAPPRVYQVSSAAAIGLPGALLRRLFEQDQRGRGTPFFIDPLEARGYAGLVAYEDGLPLARLDDLAHGHEALTPTTARYLTVASDHSGVLGFAEFVISFDHADPTVADTLSAGFALDLERIYVCKRQRGQCVSTALLRHAAQVFGQELVALAESLTPVLSRHGLVLPLHHSVEANWLSASGRLATINLGYEMDAEIAMFEATSPFATYVSHARRTTVRGR